MLAWQDPFRKGRQWWVSGTTHAGEMLRTKQVQLSNVLSAQTCESDVFAAPTEVGFRIG